jgi:hypothetical protein
MGEAKRRKVSDPNWGRGINKRRGSNILLDEPIDVTFAVAARLLPIMRDEGMVSSNQVNELADSFVGPIAKECWRRHGKGVIMIYSIPHYVISFLCHIEFIPVNLLPPQWVSAFNYDPQTQFVWARFDDCVDSEAKQVKFNLDLIDKP